MKLTHPNTTLAALQQSCVKGHKGCASLLIDAGADLEAKRRGGKTALMEACIFGVSISF